MFLFFDAIDRLMRFPLVVSLDVLEAMERRRGLLAFFLLVSLIWGSEARELSLKQEHNSHIYSRNLATVIAQYASAVYMSDLTELFTWTCSRCGDKIKAFNIIELIVDIQSCLQAFVGVDEDLNSIIIAFRGTQENSIQNWVEDLFWKQLDLSYPGMAGAMVHHGFYSAYHNTTIRDGVLEGVQLAKSLYGDIGIIVTGHSMGGAMASFCALDLTVLHGARDLKLMTFGQPRIGNSVFASYFKSQVPNTIRVVNRHDMVPHLPPYYPFFPSKTYHHFPREVWLYDISFGSLVYSVEKICDGSGEDPTCSRSTTGNSVSDHLNYYGADMQADAWGSCKIVMGRLAAISRRQGNFVVAKDVSAAKVQQRPLTPYKLSVQNSSYSL